MGTEALTLKTRPPRRLERAAAAAQSAWRSLRRNAFALIGLGVVVVALLVALLAPVIAPYPPLVGNPNAVLQPPSLQHLFGTDGTGFDIFSRVLYATRTDLAIAAGAVLISTVLGTILGSLAAYFGRGADEGVMRVMDMLSAFPGFVLAMGVVAALGPSAINLIIAIGIVNVPVTARVIRSRVLTVKEMQYVTAAQAIGNPRWRILVVHIVPNSLSPVIVQATLQAAYAILIAAGLSYIGLGLRVPAAEWGVMINMGVKYLTTGQWWVTFFPGMAIAIAILGFNLLGDGLQDVFARRGQ